MRSLGISLLDGLEKFFGLRLRELFRGYLWALEGFRASGLRVTIRAYL